MKSCLMPYPSPLTHVIDLPQDWKLVSSISATERVKLWDHFSGPVDQETVKSDFLRKIHCKNPPFRFKVKPKSRICAEIPPMVEYHYKNPPPLLPSLRDVLRYENVHKRANGGHLNDEQLCNLVKKDLQELEEAKKKLLDFEEDIETIKRESEMCGVEIKIEENGIDSDTKEDEDTKDDVVILNNHDADAAEAQPPKRMRISSTKSMELECEETLESTKVTGTPSTTNSTLTNGLNGSCDADKIDNELKYLDMTVIKQLAFQQLQQILAENPDLVTNYQTETANKAIRDALRAKPRKIVLPSQLLTKEDIARIAEQFVSPEKAKSNEEHNDIPMRETGRSTVFYTNGFDHQDTDLQRAQAIAKRLERPLVESKIRARAVLTPVGDILTGKR